jgi:undecaprenyl-diphosphatase
MVIGSIPTAAIGLGFKEHFEAMFDSPWVVGTAFLVTGLLLLATRWIPGGVTDERSLVWWQALLIGVVQGLAITPGISRSGSTIAAGLLLGLDREFAARFSFLLSIPAIAGASLLELKDLSLEAGQALPLFVGFMAALCTGYLALILLLRLVNKGSFWTFSPYLCLVAALSFGVGLS